MKHTFTFFAVLTMALALPQVAKAYHYTFSAVAPSGQTLYYNINNGGAVVTYPNYWSYSYYNGFEEPTGSLVIPDSVTYNGATYAVTSIGDYAFRNCYGLTSVTIGNSVTSIGGSAFMDCFGLTSVTIPNSVTSIGFVAFMCCSGFTSITIPNMVTSIGNKAFSQCTRLTSVSFGEGIASIGNDAFNNCGIIGELVVPQSLISIGDRGFNACYGITEITCLGRVAPTLGEDAFEGVDTSITVNIPCGTTNLYAGRWAYFHNFNEVPFLFNVESADITQGTVAMLQEPSCDDPVAIVQATPRSGYRFDHWSDGSTQNPYTYTAMGSLTLTAYFTPTSTEASTTSWTTASESTRATATSWWREQPPRSGCTTSWDGWSPTSQARPPAYQYRQAYTWLKSTSSPPARWW